MSCVLVRCLADVLIYGRPNCLAGRRLKRTNLLLYAYDLRCYVFSCNPSEGFFMKTFFALLLLCCAISTVAPAQTGPADGKVEKDIEEKGETRLIVQLRPDSIRSASAAAYMGAVLASTSATVSAIDQRTAIVRADRAALEKLKADRSTAFIRDEPIPMALNTSTLMLGAKEAWTTGGDGGGVTVAILDTGIVDAKHPFLAGKIAMQACFSVEDARAGASSLCAAGAPALPDGSRVDFTPNSASGCPIAISGCEHGMHVAGIVAGNELAANQISGVAKGASIMAIQVFSRFDRAQDCLPAPAPCVLSFTSSQLRALQYVQSKALNYNATGQGPRIVAINLSLGGGRNGAPCDRGENSSYARRIQELRDDGVATFIAAGNDGFIDGVSFPGCISTAITVGAIAKKTVLPSATVTAIGPTDNLAMAGFSNRFEDRMVSLLSFGVDIRSSVPGPTPFKELSGTSMATPHAAAAYAVLAAAFPAASVNEIVDTVK
jgi:subtilisin family serine protease